MSDLLRAPFPWFGSKRRAADAVWRALGHGVANYVEPFCGSLAVLLGRPGGAGKIETVNDADRYVANFWRAVQADPYAVAAWADGPVNEADLHARHQWLVNQSEFRERMHTDPDFYDCKIAGFWVWGICQSIGMCWCRSADGQNVPRGLPLIGVGRGASADVGIHSRAAHHATIAGTFRHALGVFSVPDAPPAFAWFKAIALRLRRVRVACGDWRRVLSDSVLGNIKTEGARRPCAVFLDPPYAGHEAIYSAPSSEVAAAARAWALEHGDDPDLRIALCGYEAEHGMPAGWTMHVWKSVCGYAGEGNSNGELERIWFSPHCLKLDRQQNLFGAA